MTQKFELKGTAPICNEIERIAGICINDYNRKTGISLEGFSTVVTLLPPDSKGTRNTVKGHFTLNKTWMNNKGETFREIAVNPYLLGYMTSADVVETIYHEVIHLYCLASGIKDCSTNGRHNTRFAEAANISKVIEAYDTQTWLGYSTRLTELGRQWVKTEVIPRQHELTKLLPAARKRQPKRITLICKGCNLRAMVPYGKWKTGKAFIGCFSCMETMQEQVNN